MNELYTNKEEIIAACNEALKLAPAEYPPDLPPSKDLLDAPDWYRFEHNAWPIGERIRQSLQRNPKLKVDCDVLEKIIEVIRCKNLRRGQQSFSMALGFVTARPYADDISPFLSDKDIDGQIVDTLLKMKADGHAREVEPLVQSKHTWIKNLAKKYLERYPLSIEQSASNDAQ